MKKIPVEFYLNGKRYQGFLQAVSGSASAKLYHLMVGSHYQGQLVYTNGWAFYSSKGNPVPELAEYLGTVVEASARS